MLVSKHKKFIFIHIYKTAGTSVRSALMPHTLSLVETYLNLVFKRLGKAPYVDPQPSKVHVKASEAIELIGVDVYHSYFSFAFTRNPWDWQVSLYKYMLKSPEHHQHDLIKQMSGFDEYIQWRCNEEVRLQYDFIYSNSGKLLVDFVGRFETIDQDFEYICSRIGVKATLPKLNVSNTKPYTDFYTSETRSLVKRFFQKDIECFNYKFD